MDKFEVIKSIGSGNFGNISKIKRKSDGEIMVWKEIDFGRMREEEKKHIVSEVNILKELNHPNIVRYHDRIIDKKNLKIYILMEFCVGGDLGKIIKSFKKKGTLMKEEIIWRIMSQMCMALNECHSRREKILHRDIKASNVFLDKDTNIKLGDFGLSRVLGEQSVFAYSHVGTPYYMSPEQIEEQSYDEKSDIWGLGCLIYELTTLNPPFEAKNQLSLAQKIKYDKVKRIPSRFSDDLMKVIDWMLCKNQKDRPNVTRLLSHPKVRGFTQNMKEEQTTDKLEQFEALLLKKEEELKRKEKDIDRKYAQLLKERVELDSQGMELDKREKLLEKREKEALKREMELLKKEKELNSYSRKSSEIKLSSEIRSNSSKKSVEVPKNSTTRADLSKLDYFKTARHTRKNSSNSRKNSNSRGRSINSRGSSKEKFSTVTPEYLSNLDNFLGEGGKYSNKTVKNKFDPSIYQRKGDWLDNYSPSTNLNKVNQRFKRISSSKEKSSVRQLSKERSNSRKRY